MRRRNRQYTYRLTTRGIEYLTNRTPSLNTSVPQPFRQDWSIRRRHDTKTAPYNFEIWVNDSLFVARYTAATIRRWRQTGYIVPHADMWHKHIRYTEALLRKVSISKEERTYMSLEELVAYIMSTVITDCFYCPIYGFCKIHNNDKAHHISVCHSTWEQWLKSEVEE